jgi:subtilisin family serine protease
MNPQPSRVFYALALFLAAGAAALGQDPAGRAVTSPKIHPQLRVRAQSESMIPVFIVLAHQPQRELFRQAEGANALYRQVAESRYRQAAQSVSQNAEEIRQAREAADAVLLRTRRQAFQAIEQAIRPEQDVLESRLTGLGATHITRYQGINMLAADISASALDTLEADPGIAQVFAVEKYAAQLATSVPDLGAPAFWNARYTGQGESVGILDSGVRTNHPAFGGRTIVSQVFLTNGRTDPCFADNAGSVQDLFGHGTHVAGIVVSQGSAGWTNYQGVAKGLGTLYNLKVGYKMQVSSSCDPVGAESDPRDVLAALDWAVANTPLKIFNYSFGSPTTADDDGFTQSIDQYIDNYGLTITIAAGNGGIEGYPVTSPGIAYNGITVANWISRGAMNPASSGGSTAGGRYKPDLAAPGTDIYSTAYNWDSVAGTADDFASMTGTSMATPHIAGAAALLESAGVSDPLAVKALLINTADFSGFWQGNSGWGYTNLNTAQAQLNYATGSLAPGDIRLYRASPAGTFRASLAWNRHVSGSTSTLNFIHLYLYQEDTGAILTSSTDSHQNVQEVTAEPAGGVVLAVMAGDWPGSTTSESYGVAFSAPAITVTGPRIVPSCSLPSSIPSGSQFTVTCAVANGGDLLALSPALFFTLPDNFSEGPLPSLGDIAPGSDSTAVLNLTASSVEGSYTIHWTVSAPPSFGLASFAAAGTLTATVHPAVPAPVLISPVNGSVGASLLPTLTWTASAGAVTYDVYLGPAWPPPLVTTTTQTRYTTNALFAGTVYYWQVEARNANGASSSAFWSFTTQAAPAGQQGYVILTVAGNGSLGDAGDGGPAGSAQLYTPSSVAIDAAMDLYIGEGDGVIRKVAPDGTISTVALLPSSALAADATGNLYVASANTATVYKIAPDHTVTTVAGNGTPGYSGDGGPATSAQLSGLQGLAVSTDGSLYVSDGYDAVIRKVAASGIITTVAGNGTPGYSGDSGPATSAQLMGPEGLAMNPSGDLYIADVGNSRIRKLTRDGIITTVAGNGTMGYSGDGGPATSAQLFQPAAVALDAAGNLYIADSMNFRIRKVTPNGIITTVAGNGGGGYSGDGGPPLNAQIRAVGLALDSTGSLYFPDGLSRVRAVIPVNPSCQFHVDQTVLAALYTGGTFPVSIQTGPACWWGASGFPWWISGQSSGKGPGTINLSVASNSGPLRTATVSVAGTAITVTQSDGFCNFGLSPASVSLPAAGGTFTVSVSGCANVPWAVANSLSWVIPAEPASGVGDGTVSFTVARNTGGARSGTFTIADCTFEIRQLGSPVTTPLRFVPVPPCRVADTRWSAGPFGGPRMTAASSRSFTIPQSACGIPATAQAYSLNVTVVPQGPLSYLTLWPTGQSQPFVSTLNSWGGIVVANAAMVPAGSGGDVSVYVTNPTDVILDINGYFDSPGGSSYSFYPATPCRIADTRNPAGPFGGPSLSAGQGRDFPVPSSSCGLPSSASAYSMNVTVVPGGYLGYLTTWPTGQPQPNVSTLNSWTGKVVANAALVPAGAGGSTSVYASNPTAVVLDTNGYFAPPGAAGGLNFYPVTPCRIADTRNGDGPFGGPVMEGAATRSFPIPSSGCGIPATAAAYSLNVTVVPDGPLSYLTTWPMGQTRPNVSTLNSWDGTVVANAAIVPAGAGGAINVYVTHRTHVILDINGYFAP